jgi:outer membrane receptor protein involved in Fe transport
LLCAVLGVLLDPIAQSQSQPVHVAAIAPMPLERALAVFARQTGLQIVYVSEATKGAISKGSPSGLTPRETLTRLLDGTGVTFEFLNERTVRIFRIVPGADSPAESAPIPDSADSSGSTPPPQTGAGFRGDTNTQDHKAGKGEASMSGRGLLARLAGLFALCGSAAHPDGACAQEEPQARLEEVVVTAQKRVENVQSVPISAQVISGQALASQNHTSFEDLTQVVPGVNISSDGWNNNLFIRGIGSGGATNFDQSVATFEDDIYHGRSKMSETAFLDLDRIEILKGPQSTFFGNNAIAGALNIVTRKPGDTFEADARALYGMHGQYAAEGAVTLPVSEQVSFRAAAIFDGDGGWIKNVNTGGKAPIRNNKAGRVTVAYRPGDNLDATLKIEGSFNKTTGTAFGEPQQFVNCPPAPPLTPSSNGSHCAEALALHLPIGLENDQNSGLPGQFNFLSSLEDVLTVNYHRWGHTITSVTGYSHYSANMHWDVANLPTPTYTANQQEHYHQFSQELRLVSPADRRVSYLLGVYYQTDHLVSHQGAVLNFLNPIIEAFIPPLVPYLPLNLQIHYPQDEEIYSAFASLSWSATDRLKLTAGVRGSEVKKDALLTNSFLGAATDVYGGGAALPPAIESLIGQVIFPVGTSPPLRRTDRALMPSAGIQYQLLPRVMTYFSYSRGFKAGGYNEGGALPPSLPVGFGPEHVNAYELGLKSEWLDDRLLVNLDVFRSDYQDLQVSAGFYNPALNAGEVVFQNAAVSRSQGVELETRWAPTRDFRLAVNATYLDSHYVSYPSATQTTLAAFCSGKYVLPYCSVYPNPVPQFTDRSGERTQYAPRWSGSISGSYSLLLPRDLKLTATVSPYLTSSYNDQDPYILGTAGYVRLDARLTVASSDERWAVDLIGKNLTDRVIVISGSAGVSIAQKEEPLNVAVQARYRW